MIELGIWVIRVSGNFIRSGDTFQYWSGLFFGNLHFVNRGWKYILKRIYVKIFTKIAKLSVLKFLEWETVVYTLTFLWTFKNLIESHNLKCSGIMWQLVPLLDHCTLYTTRPLLDHCTAIVFVVLHVFLVPIISSHDKLWGLARRVFTLFFITLVGSAVLISYKFKTMHWKTKITLKHKCFLKPPTRASSFNQIFGITLRPLAHTALSPSVLWAAYLE